jgi:hypothetical protein
VLPASGAREEKWAVVATQPGRVLINRRRCPLSSDPDRPCATAANVAMGQKPTFIRINSGMRLQNQEFDNLSAVCHEHEIDQLNGMF